MKPSTKVIVASVMILSLLIGGILSLYYLPLDSIPFETIEKNTICGIHDNRTLIITDNETWSSIWTEIQSITTLKPDLPFVNFTSEWLVAIFLGQRATGGYYCNIHTIERTSLAYRIHYQELDYHGLTQALTFPYHIVKITGYPLDLPIQFVYTYISIEI